MLHIKLPLSSFFCEDFRSERVGVPLPNDFLAILDTFIHHLRTFVNGGLRTEGILSVFFTVRHF